MSRHVTSRRVTSRHVALCRVMSHITSFHVILRHFTSCHVMSRRGGITGGFGWVQTHPLSKKAPMRFFRIRRLFLSEGVGRRGGGRVEREKHELCQIVLNKQQHSHVAIIAFNFDH